MKEEFGNPQRLGHVLVVCTRFSELILMSAYLQVLARGVDAYYIMRGIYRDF